MTVCNCVSVVNYQLLMLMIDKCLVFNCHLLFSVNDNVVHIESLHILDWVSRDLLMGNLDNSSTLWALGLIANTDCLFNPLMSLNIIF